MAFWSSQTLLTKLPPLIGSFDANKIEQASYTLSIGKEIFITKDHHNSDSQHTKRPLSLNEAFVIPPGQFAFLLTEESIKVPEDAIAFISMKASFKYKGLINISGFHVDPGFSGNLLFSVYNAGPGSITLQRNLPIFLIWYASLDDTDSKPRTTAGFSDIPIHILNQVSTDPIYSLQALSTEFREINHKVSQGIDQIDDTKKAVDKWLRILQVFGGIVLSIIITVSVYVGNSVTGIGKFAFEQKDALIKIIEYADKNKDASDILEKQKKELQLLSEKQIVIEAELNTLKKNHSKIFSNKSQDDSNHKQ